MVCLGGAQCLIPGCGSDGEAIGAYRTNTAYKMHFILYISISYHFTGKPSIYFFKLFITVVLKAIEYVTKTLKIVPPFHLYFSDVWVQFLLGVFSLSLGV